MARVIILYHCSDCRYEAGTKWAVNKHIKEKHEEREIKR